MDGEKEVEFFGQSKVVQMLELFSSQRSSLPENLESQRVVWDF
jgi:hypothetical protein